jgi:hypothetical protein
VGRRATHQESEIQTGAGTGNGARETGWQEQLNFFHAIATWTDLCAFDRLRFPKFSTRAKISPGKNGGTGKHNCIVVNLDVLHQELFPSTVRPRRPTNESDQDTRTGQ